MNAGREKISHLHFHQHLVLLLLDLEVAVNHTFEHDSLLHLSAQLISTIPVD